MKKRPFKPFVPTEFVTYESVTIMSNGTPTSSVRTVVKQETDFPYVPSDLYPTLEDSLRAGIPPQYSPITFGETNPADVELANSYTVDSLMSEFQSEIDKTVTTPINTRITTPINDSINDSINNNE